MDCSDLLLEPTSSARASEPQLGDCQICPDGQSQGLSCGRGHCTASQVWQSLTCLRCHPELPRTANVEWHQPAYVRPVPCQPCQNRRMDGRSVLQVGRAQPAQCVQTNVTVPDYCPRPWLTELEHNTAQRSAQCQPGRHGWGLCRGRIGQVVESDQSRGGSPADEPARVAWEARAARARC